MRYKFSSLIIHDVNQEFVNQIVDSEKHRAFLQALSGEFLPPFNRANNIKEVHRLGGIGDLSQGLGGLAINGVMMKGDWRYIPLDKTAILSGEYSPTRWANGSSAVLQTDAEGRPNFMNLKPVNGGGYPLSFSLYNPLARPSSTSIVITGGGENQTLHIDSPREIEIAKLNVVCSAMKFYQAVYDREQFIDLSERLGRKPDWQ